MAPRQTPPGAPSTWAVVILRGKEVDRLGTVEAPDQREAYQLAIEQFNVPVERGSCSSFPSAHRNSKAMSRPSR